ncbi:MAG: ABC transporter permease [Actinobacteria bacterium]|nr:ABC transporter permease [Actinomycetota bacterium]
MKWYKEVLENRLFISALKNSVYVGILVSLISIIIGTLASFALTRYRFKFKNIISTTVLFPMTIPAIILGISLLSFFSYLEIPLSLLTVIISHALFCIPFVILIMNSQLIGFDVSVEEAAMDLGANAIQAFRYVIFPIIRPSLVGVMMITFALSFDEFLITFFVIGRQNTLPIIIWGMLRRGVSPTINVISTLVLVISMTLILIVNRYAKIKTFM